MTYAISVGDRFGKLTVLEVCAKTEKYERRLVCRCDCGKTHRALAARIYRGLSTQCKTCVAAPITLAPHERLLRIKERNYRVNAKRRGLTFELDAYQFRGFIQAPCQYCGLAPANGIDRSDNALGYVPGNCVSCCADCNRAKSNMTSERFRAWIIRLATTQGFSL